MNNKASTGRSTGKCISATSKTNVNVEEEARVRYDRAKVESGGLRRTLVVPGIWKVLGEGDRKEKSGTNAGGAVSAWGWQRFCGLWFELKVES